MKSIVTDCCLLGALEDHGRSVNQLLADLRRTNLSGQQPSSATVAQITAPSVPPNIATILQLPETPAPAPRRRARVDSRGRRPPPGPPAPRSWLSLSRHAPHLSPVPAAADLHEYRPLPDIYTPDRGSLIDIVLRKIALSWEFQKSYNVYYLYSLPSHLRVALISHLSVLHEPGLSVSDLRILLTPQAPPEEDGVPESPQQSPSSLNEDIFHLDLTASVGKSLRLRDLSNLLFPASADEIGPLQESWETPETTTIPRALVPNLTYLSLAVSPEQNVTASWKQLLSFSTHLPTLTHLSLAYWPEPSLTPNAKYASVIGPQGRTMQYGGTNPYSHTLDNDWSEAVIILRKLSKNLYGLEYLDLTGCSSWFKALMADASDDRIDWVGRWGKVTTLVLDTGYGPPSGVAESEVLNYKDTVARARAVERHIRSQRAGKGRWITVETDKDPAAR